MVVRSRNKRKSRGKKQALRKTYKKQRGGALEDDALAALKANGVVKGPADFDTLMRSPAFALPTQYVVGGVSQTQSNEVFYGNYTFQQKKHHRTYDLVAWKTTDPGKTVILHTESD